MPWCHLAEHPHGRVAQRRDENDVNEKIQNPHCSPPFRLPKRPHPTNTNRPATPRRPPSRGGECRLACWSAGCYVIPVTVPRVPRLAFGLRAFGALEDQQIV